MALHRKRLVEEIVQGLSYLQSSVVALSSLNLNDLAVASEDFFALLLSAVFDLNLKNLNQVEQNHPAIDLGDPVTGECFQVTADIGRGKIQETLDKFLERGLHRHYSRVRFLVIGHRRKPYGELDLSKLLAEKVKFSPADDILTLEKLNDLWQALPLEKLETVHSIVTREIRYPRSPTEPSSARPGLDLSPYFGWMADATACIVVPGLGVSLPTSQCAERYLKEELRGQSDGDSSRERLESAVDVVARTKALLVQGAAGTGKSTLLVQLAHYLALHGVLTLRVRLPSLLKRYEATGSLDLALAESAADQSPLAAAQLLGLLGHPLQLLADGLDECAQASTTVARALARWSLSHANARVLVTTRGSPKDHPALSAWETFRLHPITPAAAMLLADRILIETGLDQEECKAAALRLKGFRDQAGDRADWTHTPLAIGLLLALAVRERKLDCGRAALLGQVFDLLRHARREGRSGPRVAASVLDVSIDALGWVAQSDPGLGLTGAIAAVERELVRLGASPLQASLDAENALLRWEEAGLVERTGGCSPQLGFVHRQFQEFAAARNLLRQAPSQMTEHVAAVGRLRAWHEALLFASGLGATDRIVDSLLVREDPDDPCSIEGLTAAHAELEAPHADESRIARIAAALARRIQSPIPLVAYEAGQLASSLARLSRTPFSQLGRSAANHPQAWTRAIGWTLRAVVGDLEAAELDEALRQGILEDFVCQRGLFGSPGGVPEASRLRTEFLRESTAWLLRRRDEQATAVVRNLLVGSRFPSGLIAEFHEQLMELGLRDLLEPLALEFASSMRLLPSILTRMRAGEIAFLRAVLAGRDGDSAAALSAGPASKLPSLRRLATVIGLNDSASASDLDAVAFEDGRPVLELVVRGAIVAAGLDEPTLRAEAQTALMAATEDEHARVSFWSMGVGRPENLDWRLAAAKLQPSAELLALGLSHPSRVIAVCAAHFLEAVDPEVATRAVAKTLARCSEFGIYLAAHLCHEWGPSALEVFLDRCEAVDSSLAMVLEMLPQIEVPSRRASSILERGLFAKDPRLAASAARGVAKLDSTSERRALICRALEDWSCRGLPDEIEGVVQASPRSDLVRAGAAAGALGLAELSGLLSDRRFDVRSAAMESLADLALQDPIFAEDLVGRTCRGELPAAVMEEIEKAQGSELQDEWVHHALASATPSVRTLGLQMVGRRPQLTERMIEGVWGAISDGELANRNLAVQLIRDRSILAASPPIGGPAGEVTGSGAR